MEKNKALVSRGLEKVKDYQKRKDSGELQESSSSNSVIYDAIQEYELSRAQERKALSAWSGSKENEVPEFDIILNELVIVLKTQYFINPLY